MLSKRNWEVDEARRKKSKYELCFSNKLMLTKKSS
jgi:hypothetical protein